MTTKLVGTHDHARLSGARMGLAGDEIGDPSEGRGASGRQARDRTQRRAIRWSRDSHRSATVVAALGAAMDVTDRDLRGYRRIPACGAATRDHGYAGEAVGRVILMRPTDT